MTISSQPTYMLSMQPCKENVDFSLERDIFDAVPGFLGPTPQEDGSITTTVGL